tara:strand:- start:7 stop:189 length:183 start_codon:yes stop_codon:yes gene_type:complete
VTWIIKKIISIFGIGISTLRKTQGYLKLRFGIQVLRVDVPCGALIKVTEGSHKGEIWRVQ